MRPFYFIVTVFLSSFLFAPNTSAQEFIEHYSSRSNTAVIFIHGFRGDKNSFKDWPKEIHKDQSFGKPSTYLFTYPAGVNDTQTIDEIANNFALLLERDTTKRDSGTFKQYTKFVFVTHSMGGLVLRQTLINHLSIRNKTKAALFLAGPFLGSDLADNPIARIVDFATSTAAIAMLSSNPNNDNLNALRKGWDQIRHEIPSYCAYEKLDSVFPAWVPILNNKGIVVARESAIEGCDFFESVYTNHMDIAKISADPYSVTQNLLQKMYFNEGIVPIRVDNPQIVTIDSFRYGGIGKTDLPNETNLNEIREILSDSGTFEANDILKLPSAPIGWSARPITHFKPSVIVLHWSTFEAGEDCFVNGSNFNSPSCQRLVRVINTLLNESQGANLLLYTRTPDTCGNVSSFFSQATGTISREKLERVRILDLPRASVNRPKGQRYLENEAVKSALTKAVIAGAQGWDLGNSPIEGLCEVMR